MLLQREIVLEQNTGNFDKPRVVEQQRPENEFLGIDIRGQTFFGRNAGRQGHGTGIQHNRVPCGRLL